jgi:hypothetical protein
VDQERNNLQYHEDVSTSYVILAGTDYTTATAKIAAKANFTLYLLKIAVMVTTDNAAVNTFQDSTGTPIIACVVKASPGIGPTIFDFGPNGFALTEGKSLDHKMSAAGLAASVTITAYRKRTTGAQVS